MKRIKLAVLMMFVSHAPSALALTDQINHADKFYLSKAGVALIQTGLNSLYNAVNPSAISDVIVDNRDSKADSIPDFIDLKKDIHPNSKSPNIVALQRQLELQETGLYDKELAKRIKKLQQEKGLSPTGIIDKNTWFAIYEQPLEWKLKMVKLARENWNAILDKHRNHTNPIMVVVNIPSMKLHVYKRKESGYDLLMDSKVVVGRKSNQTPLNDFELISLKYSPNWTPTKNMLNRNLYKNGGLNLKWLEEHGLALIDETGSQRDYSELSSITAPKFVQPSGDANALGNLKFETSSKEDIYLHDTNERHLFGNNTRTYSSGCIRVKDYVALAAIVADKNPEYVEKNISKQKMFYERIPKRVPVYFDYTQVHFNDDDDMIFFADVYAKNKKK